MLRAQLWHQPEEGKPVSPQIATCLKHLGWVVAKSRVVPAAVGVPSDLKAVETVDPDARTLMIRVKTKCIAALAHEPPKRFLEIDKTMIIINGDLFQHLAPETMCPTWLFDEMAGADTSNVIPNLYEFLNMENERWRNEDSEAPRITNILCIPIFNWSRKPKPAVDPMVFDVRWLRIVASDT